jgi:hypothetical protein
VRKNQGSGLPHKAYFGRIFDDVVAEVRDLGSAIMDRGYNGGAGTPGTLSPSADKQNLSGQDRKNADFFVNRCF